MIVLGSTGSIGVNALYIAKRYNLNVDVLVAGRNYKLLNKQIKEHNPRVVVVADRATKQKIEHDRVYAGEDEIVRVIKDSSSRFVINALVGFLGLAPTVAALTSGKKVALANKESLVAAGAFIDTSNIIPIDSEHFGLWYLLQDKPISSMVITASGGAFRDWDISRLKTATFEDTQKHPNWSMGQKITIDSATMVNKLFELLEARWLFGKGSYDAVIETRSIIHAVINFVDGSSTAHIAHTDMKLPIAYAILGKVDENILPHVDLTEIGNLEFRKIEKDRYPVWQIKEELLKKPKLGVVVNAANEAAIKKFIDKKIAFTDISKEIVECFYEYEGIAINSIDDVFEADKIIREKLCG